MTPNFLRNQYSDLFGADMLPVLEEMFRFELSQHPSRRGELFKIVPTERDIWQSSELHDMGLFQEVAEGTEYSVDRPRQGAAKTLIPAKFGLGFSISEEAVEDGRMDFISDATRKLAKSGAESQEISAMNVFNNGFSAETTADGVALFSASHTLPRGGTFRNKPSSDADLSVTALDTMLADFEQVFVGDTGIIYKMIPKKLVVHPNSKRYAKEIVGSDLKPDSAENNLNSLKEDGLQVISSPHLTDTDAWFVLAEPASTGLRIISRKSIETKAAGPDVGFLTDAIYYKARYREKIGAIHAYGAMGTSGS